MGGQWQLNQRPKAAPGKYALSPSSTHSRAPTHDPVMLLIASGELCLKNPRHKISFLRPKCGMPSFIDTQTQSKKSVENEDKDKHLLCRRNDSLVECHISVPRDLFTLGYSSCAAGVVEPVFDGLGFVIILFPN